jgi:hypothetical protein
MQTLKIRSNPKMRQVERARGAAVYRFKVVRESQSSGAEANPSKCSTSVRENRLKRRELPCLPFDAGLLRVGYWADIGDCWVWEFCEVWKP